MHAYVELSNTARTDSTIQSLSWMSYVSTPPSTSHLADDNNQQHPNDNNDTQTTPTNTLPSLINLREGWLATGNTNHIVSVTYTSTRSDQQQCMTPDRTNFNLRAHRTEVRLVAWNVPFQKLATVDEKGVIFVWVKHENRWSLELINDRSHPVTDMAWSYDGRMTVICYEDGFVLVGSVTGQRYWSAVVNTHHATISAVTWTPDVAHVILGTTSGALLLMDHHGNTTESFSLSTQPIIQLLYSCNKFYPGAPDSTASKFLNDDYILACSLENGQVLFLNGYQDQAPIIVDTGLQNIKMDWSSPGEILAVAGHQRLHDLNCFNQILFYNRRGEFLHRVQIPETTRALSALCWAHGNEIVFVACGSVVYTVWITHKPMPSMLTMCQMRIKQHLLHNSLHNLDKLMLPTNLKQSLVALYRSTIKGFLPDPKTIRTFVCEPLKSQLRLQCTMKRVDNETESSIMNNNNNNNKQDLSTSTNAGATYVLYLEYLGGLIPLLTAKRVSKICPDFIIFDPQSTPKTVEHSSSPSSTTPTMSPRTLSKKNSSLLRPRSQTFHNMPMGQQQQQQQKSTSSSNANSNQNRSSLIGNRSSVYVAAETGVAGGGSDDVATTKSSSGCSSENDSDNDENKTITNAQEQKPSRKKATSKIIKHKHTNKLCTIAANIWGTRFKFHGHSDCLPETLGSVTYKTSFLHLQPRQMTVSIANSNSIRQRQQQQQQQQQQIANVTKSGAVRKNKQQMRSKIDEEEDDETMTALSSSKMNVAAAIPIAPMSPQLTSVRSSLLLAQQPPPSLAAASIHEAKSLSTKKQHVSPTSSRRSQRISTIHHSAQRQNNADSSAANSSSTSPINLSRSTSPAASIANFIRPISPPCIQVKEPLSPKFSRAASTTVTNYQPYYRHRTPPIAVPSVANNVDASTASATTTLLIDDSSGYDSSETHNNTNRPCATSVGTAAAAVSAVPESCFEPETYRNWYPFNASQQQQQQKKLSLSDPTLNQTTKLVRRPIQQQVQSVATQATSPQSSRTHHTNTTHAHFSASSLQQQISNDDDDVNNLHELQMGGGGDDEDEIERLSSYEETLSKEKFISVDSTRKRYSSPRHRMMTCTSGTNDSLAHLSPSSEIDPSSPRTDITSDTCFYTMQNRPPLWNEQSQVYQLDFGGRVTLESAKNFQIEFKNKQVIQFGRIENNCYTLDFEWPFSPLQAFAVALANITQRLK